MLKVTGMGSNLADSVQKRPVKRKEDMTRSNEEKSPRKQMEKDSAVLGRNESTPVTYERTSGKKDATAIERLQAESEKAYMGLRDLVKNLLEAQGMTFRDLSASGHAIPVDEATRKKAEEMIGDGGLYSPEAVSDRIVEFAKVVSDGDKGKLEELVSAIDKGFEKARNLLGGTLPEISLKTYDLVREKLSTWQAGEN